MLVELPDAIGFWRAAGVIADADGFVVFGEVNNRPAAWSSSDGVAWTSSALPGSDFEPVAAAASANVTVLLGTGSTDRCAHPFGETIWRRAHGGGTWEAAPFVQELFCAGGFPNIAAQPGTFVVAGTNGGEQPFAWQSDDGLTWRDASAGLPADVPPVLLAAAGAGFIELGRGPRTDAEQLVPGEDWAPIQAPPVPPAFNRGGPSLEPAVLAETSHGLLAIFESDDGAAHSGWRRDDSGVWSEVGLAGVQVGDAIGQAVSIEGRPYLFATRGGRAHLLTSSDLATWADIPIPQLSAILGLAVKGNRTILVGSLTDQNEDDHPFVYVIDAAAIGALK
jgi:hypothetical protein